MTYQRDLAFALRVRGVAEKDVADIVAEVDAHAQEGIVLEEFFGAPDEYAARFPEGPKRLRDAAWWTKVSAVVAVVWIVAVTVVAALGVDLPVRFGVIALWPALGLMVLGMVVDIVWAHRRPV